jgi:hypothetical protein
LRVEIHVNLETLKLEWFAVFWVGLGVNSLGVLWVGLEERPDIGVSDS